MIRLVNHRFLRIRLLLIAAASSLAFCGNLRAREVCNETAAVIHIRVDPQAVIGTIPADFLGLGYETSAVAQPDFFDAKNVKMVQLYRNLAPHGIVRIGGNVSDHTRYVLDGLPAARSQREVTTINQANLRDLGEFLRVTGWQALWGLNLGTGSKEEAAAEAVAVDAALGSQLHSFEIGNEVDFLPRFAKNYEAYHAAYADYKAAIRAVLPEAAFSGPDVAWSTDWCLKFAAAEGGDLRLLTQHYYRTGANKPEATMEKLLQRDTACDHTLAKLRNAGQGRGISNRICEVNSFYGGGKQGVSDTFGSALWCLDYLFQLAADGCGGVNMETDVNQLGWVSHYSPIFHEADGSFTARPEYYALLAFSLAGTGEMVKLAREGDPEINLCAYATQNELGQVWITIVNKDLRRDSHVEINVPGMWSSAQVYPLRAASVGSTGQVTLAGSEVSENGKWTPQPQSLRSSVSGRWQISVPRASAMLVQLRR